ncbi:glycosyltransferase family 4 protein [Pedobacter deserti]|uniref:glycosyltransferase family 4 protein n=1 Tax=Pedobacter deserti TaxID=2817382 RepID=UPI00210A0B8A|nr:glycosyltransferase family 4 protein [Pedobacter sp. SYSU D00382]
MRARVDRQCKLRIFTWHIHGSYLFYLSQGDYEIYIPVKEQRTEGYYGRGSTFPFGDNVHEVPANEVRNMSFDLILYQTDENYLVDQYEILSDTQRALPRIYLEHDPPWDHPTNARHPVTDPKVLLVHVTHFNALMWDNYGLKTRVIEHGVLVPELPAQEKTERGIVVINNLPTRGRLLGLDIFEQVRERIPLDLVGMGAEKYGIGEVLHPDLPAFTSKYRFFFNPIRYTSLGLAVCESMMLGLPVVGLATTEMAVTIKNGYSGYVHTDIDFLISKMEYLLSHPAEAEEMGRNARQEALRRFNIKRFAEEWTSLFNEVVNAHN